MSEPLLRPHTETLRRDLIVGVVVEGWGHDPLVWAPTCNKYITHMVYIYVYIYICSESVLWAPFWKGVHDERILGVLNSKFGV